MNIIGEIREIKYKATMSSPLDSFTMDSLEDALRSHSSFTIRIDNRGEFAISRWVSAKRTRSYPYARVYDTYSFSGKKITIIPLCKDEGADGDRDFIQFDTISLMSLLGVYVIIAYYVDAERNQRYENKITNQVLDIKYIKDKISQIADYQSDALHWNMGQLAHADTIAELALTSYTSLSRRLGVRLHSDAGVKNLATQLKAGGQEFKENSRAKAIMAQQRESRTKQPKEFTEGEKSDITITNFYNGFYAFTVDEAYIERDKIRLVEAKHTERTLLPSMEDMKDGIVKMIIFSNLSHVEVNGARYGVIPELKLTSKYRFSLSPGIRLKGTLTMLEAEAKENGFEVSFNGEYIARTL